MKRIAVVDFGMGNLHSVHKALAEVGGDKVQVVRVDNGDDMLAADQIVFPGQGAASGCMQSLDAGGLSDAILRAAREKPFLGICMGVQVLFEHSEEGGGVDCLGLFAGKVCSMKDRLRGEKKIPHMGWSRVRQRVEHPLWEGIDDDSHFYFAHSYCAVPEDAGIVAADTDYGGEFVCAVAGGSVFAVQFHPEKSSVDGLRLLRNFTRWSGSL